MEDWNQPSVFPVCCCASCSTIVLESWTTGPLRGEWAGGASVLSKQLCWVVFGFHFFLKPLRHGVNIAVYQQSALQK